MLKQTCISKTALYYPDFFEEGVESVVALAILGYCVLAVYDLRPLYKQKLWRDFWVSAVLGALSFTIAVLLCLNVKIPSPAQPIREFITSLFGK